MSAMFDDWAYQEAFEPLVPPEPSLVKEEASNLVKEHCVAIEEPHVRPRAHTASSLWGPHLYSKPRYDTFLDAPLNKAEISQNFNSETWLGAADPSVYRFDPLVWDLEVANYVNAQNSAKAAAEIATRIRNEARVLSKEINWIVTELELVRTQELQPLLTTLEAASELERQKQEADQVKTVLHDVWDAYESASRILRGPAPKAIPHIPNILRQAFNARQFCVDHPDFCDMQLLSLSWKQCAQRSLAIALAYTSYELRRLTSRISNNVKESSGNMGAVQALIYTKFGADAAFLAPTIRLLRENANNGAESELQLPFWDLQNNYFQLRSTLTQGQFNELALPLENFQNVTSEFEEACRRCLVHFKQSYTAEEQLFTELFGEPSTAEFWGWLSDASDRLYGNLRRIILHETDVNKLCQVIVLVGEQKQEEEEGALDLTNSSSTTSLSMLDINQRKRPESPLVSVRKDAQNRLLFIANVEVDNLAKLEVSTQDFMRSKFPPIEKSLELLEQVYQILDPVVFNDLALRCVRESINMLNKVVNLHLDHPNIHLYHIKQLLILQSQVVEFDLRKTTVQEIDFSGIKNLVQSYRQRVSLRELVVAVWQSVPKVVETMFDAMEEIFSALRRAVDQWCSNFVKQFDLANASESLEKSTEFREEVAARVSDTKSVVFDAISDYEVRDFLLDSLQEAFMDQYTREYRKLGPEKLGSDYVMDIDTMNAWLSSTIGS